MRIRRMFEGRWLRGLGLAGVAAAGYVAGTATDLVRAQQPGAPLPALDKRVVAYIYNTVPVTREELGDFLIARGGYEKLDLLVNKKIIEVEAANRKVGVTAIEVQAALENDIKGLGITLDQFEKEILKKRYNKSLYEWTEDVVKPKLLLGKMCQDQVKVTEQDLQRAFENKYGEKRRAKIICWNEKDLRAAQKQWDEARKSDEEFDRIARSQADPRLAAHAGLIEPVSKYPDVENDTCTTILWQLKVGEVSQLFQTPAGVMCIKLIEIVPADATSYKITGQALASLKAANLPPQLYAKLEPLQDKVYSKADFQGELVRILNADLVKLLTAETGKPHTAADLQRFHMLIMSQAADQTATYAGVRETLHREALEKKQNAEIPKFFNELKQRANPNLLLKGPPNIMDIQEAAKQEIQEMKQTGVLKPPGKQ